MSQRRRRLSSHVSNSAILMISFALILPGSRGIAQPNTPLRWEAQYAQIHFDNLETLAASLGRGFILNQAGSLTSNPSEIISGKESIKGAYFGTGTHTLYLQTDSSILPLAPNHAYQVTFQYKILVAPSNGFEVLFFSPTGGAAGNFLPSSTLTGQAGTTGTATLTSTLGAYTDYQARWNISGTGAIAIDNIQLTDVAAAKPIAFDDAEGTGPVPGSGIQLQNGASLVTDPSLVVAGQGSIRLKNFGSIVTNSTVLPLAAKQTYIVQLQYRILSRGSIDQVLTLWLQPAGTAYSQQIVVSVPGLLKNAPLTGTFSAGALTATASQWVLNISASADADVVVDNITIFRQDSVSTSSQPSAWTKLNSLPYPRLGEYMLGTTIEQARSGGDAEGPPYRLSIDQVESTLAFADVIVGLNPNSQTMFPDSIRRLRALNPSAVIFPYRIAEEQSDHLVSYTPSDTNLEYQFMRGVADEWYLRDSQGHYVGDPDYAFLRKMNISSFCPSISGETYLTYTLNWLNQTVFPSGVWDGVFFDNLFGKINPHIPNFSNPALVDADYNHNGIRDETPAWISETTRTAAAGMLQQLRSSNGDMQLVVGNTGAMPELNLAPWVNGYVFECMNAGWSNAAHGGEDAPPTFSQAGWRAEFDAYRKMQAETRMPRMNVLEGCGPYSMLPGNSYSVPTVRDLQSHRLTMGTALLSDGFYEFALHGSLSAPLWMDEYSVDAGGTAVQDRAKKGYLGQPLADAVELTDAGSVVLQEAFETGVLPASITGSPAGAVSIAQTAAAVITGTGSLVISNPDHTRQGFVSASVNLNSFPLAAGSNFLAVFDWKILETVDGNVQVAVCCSNGQSLDFAQVPGIVSNDSGTVRFPFTLPAAGNLTLRFAVAGGGGKVAIDNIRIYQGGFGPWRRDFEGGFVLVNPLSQPHTFSAPDLAGILNRTGIKRIKGTQSLDVNNGQPVTGSLTLTPFDAVILLADPVRLKLPVLTGVANAAGGQPGAVSGGFVSLYGSNFTPLPYDDWSKAITNNRLPTQLDGISVTIAGKPAYINVITPGQINIQAPDLGSGNVPVTVTTPAGTSTVFTANSQVFSPAFFQWAGNQPVATHADYSLAAKNGTFPGAVSVPAKPGEVVILWGTGFGPTNPAVPAGQQPAVQAPPTQTPVTVTLDGIKLSVLGAVLSSYAATYQIAIQIPPSIADGEYPVVATVGGAQSPTTVLLTVHR
jgi:uncharacterized protein (TIGR03437 family)